MDVDQRAFHTEEYRLLKAEISAHFKLIYDVFIWATLADAAIMVWLLTSATQIRSLGNVAALAQWVPFFLAIIVATAFVLIGRSTDSLGRYLRKLEGAMAATGLGWEASPERDSNVAGARAGLMLAWGAVLIANVVFAIFVR